MNLQEVFKLAKQLSKPDKERLIKYIVLNLIEERNLMHQLQQTDTALENELMYERPIPRKFKSLWGLCADLGKAPSAEEIDAAITEE